jgi:hypothetical protein
MLLDQFPHQEILLLVAFIRQCIILVNIGQIPEIQPSTGGIPATGVQNLCSI